jgi:hypothetical protein
MEVPMLDEEEFAEVARLHSEAMQNTKHFREATGSDLKPPKVADLFRPVRDKYEQLAGMKESNENAIMHHASSSGPLWPTVRKMRETAAYSNSEALRYLHVANA